MLHSKIDDPIGDYEFDLFSDQDHFETVWEKMGPQLDKYITEYFDNILYSNPSSTIKDSFILNSRKIILDNEKLNEKYTDLFSENKMQDEYCLDTDGFHTVILKKECDIIRKTYQSKSEALFEWKFKYNDADSDEMFDTFNNFLIFGREYDAEKDELAIMNMDTILDNEFDQMADDGCFLIGVIGTGIVSNILNHIYPRTFPGKYKVGMFALFFLSGCKPIQMKSDSSEFLMVKDDIYTKTHIIEADHNYYYPYATFALFSLRIYRTLQDSAQKRFGVTFNDDYRYLFTNDFYQYVFDQNIESVTTLAGNDDVYKFGITY